MVIGVPRSAIKRDSVAMKGGPGPNPDSSEDGAGVDLGYPSTVELASGKLLTVWYESMKASPHAVLRMARWSLDS